MMKLLITLFVILLLIYNTAAVNNINDEATVFLSKFNKVITGKSREYQLIDWLYNTNITDYNEKQKNIKAKEFADFMNDIRKNASVYFNELGKNVYANDIERQLKLLKSTGELPKNSHQLEKLIQLGTEMESIYSKTNVTIDNVQYDLEPGLTHLMANSYDYELLKKAWVGWHDKVGSDIMKDKYIQFVKLLNIGAQDNGYENTADLWLSKYDLPIQEFINELEEQYELIKPLYEELHCYVRNKLSKIYGKDLVPNHGPIPAHLLGNMWAQSWINLYDKVKPFDDVELTSVTEAMKKQNYTVEKMFKSAEEFYLSLGFQKLPETFWTHSMLTKPLDRKAVCHGSAWGLEWFNNSHRSYSNLDLRIKMCTTVNEEDLFVVFHEEGHLFYDQQYSTQPYLFRNSANDGFHEAVGDTIRLSASTFKNLIRLGLLTNEDISKINVTKLNLNYQMSVALDKIAFLPFGFLVDKWRWSVFSSQVLPDEYNEAWWELRLKYQGLSPPNKRPPNQCDACAKYHVPANVPYLRYYIAYILQYQFHEAFCKKSGQYSLTDCSIYNSSEVGDAFRNMLKLGSSKPWMDALQIGIGSNKLNAQSIMNYFEPLLKFLKEQNQDLQCGWDDSSTNSNIKSAEDTFIIIFLSCVVVSIVILIMYYIYQKKKVERDSYSRFNTEESEIFGDDNEWNEIARRGRINNDEL